ncbi:MAG: DNA-3-methyladenine glycosylase 2 family protein, partial [Deltaproteobacteria bacterium]
MGPPAGAPVWHPAAIGRDLHPEPPLDRRLPLSAPLDLPLTLRLMCLWGGTTWMQVDGDGAWYAARTRQGPATVRLTHGGDHLAAEAWGPGAAALLDEVPALVGLDRPPLAALSLDHPVLRDITRRHPGFRVGRSGRLYPRLVSAALAQKV